MFREALSPDDYNNVLLLLFPTNSHQPNPANLRLCIGLRLCMRRQKSPILLFFTPQTFLLPQLFPRSILLPPVIGVDAPPPVYSGRECWKRTKNYQTSNKFSSFVKGDLNVCRVALSPDDYINVLLLFPTNSHQPNPTNLRLCVGLRSVGIDLKERGVSCRNV